MTHYCPACELTFDEGPSSYQYIDHLEWHLRQDSGTVMPGQFPGQSTTGPGPQFIPTGYQQGNEGAAAKPAPREERREGCVRCALLGREGRLPGGTHLPAHTCGGTGKRAGGGE
jgi:hypothetical protein